jgi:hypothetical protein
MIITKEQQMQECSDVRMYGVIARCYRLLPVQRYLLAPYQNDEGFVPEDSLQHYVLWFFKRVASADGTGTAKSPSIMAIQVMSATEIGLERFEQYGDGDCYWVSTATYLQICDAVANLNI